MHLKYNMMSADMSGETRHAQLVMKDPGITYQVSTPQSIYDSWWFFNCKNVPAELPPFLTELKVDPMKCVGRGLSQQEAEAIVKQQGEG